MFQETENGVYEADFGTTLVQFQYGLYRNVKMTGKCVIKLHCGHHNCNDVMLHVPGHSYWIDESHTVDKVAERLNRLIVRQFELDGIEYQEAVKEMSL